MSAHARTEGVPADPNVIEGDVDVLEAPLPSIPILLEVWSVNGPAPFAVVDVWKKLENEDPVEAVPMFEISEVKVVGVPEVRAPPEELLYTS